MPTTTITRRFEFDAGHRVPGHAGKCKNYHGHRYVALVTCEAPVQPDGMILDFGIVKDRLGAWIDRFLDHAMILQKGDPFITHSVALGSPTVCEIEEAPTAETLARLIWIEATRILPEVDVTRVRLYETPNCYADYTP